METTKFSGTLPTRAAADGCKTYLISKKNVVPFPLQHLSKFSLFFRSGVSVCDECPRPQQGLGDQSLEEARRRRIRPDPRSDREAGAAHHAEAKMEGQTPVRVLVKDILTLKALKFGITLISVDFAVCFSWPIRRF